jgi:DNA-binding HxlR family transcriptional regulator
MGKRATRSDNMVATSSTLRVEDGDLTAPLALDRVIHERLRLAIVIALAVHDTLAFSELKAMLDLTDGNLAVHVRKLEEAGYLLVRKQGDGRTARTDYRLTAAGRRALEQYLGHMDALIRRVGGS